MAFNLPELVLESIIRDGFQNVVADPTIIDYLFSDLTKAYNSQKYGSSEIAKIKALAAKSIPVIYSYHEVDAKSPCISIMIGTDNENKQRAHLSDDYGTLETQIVDSGALQALHRVNNIQVVSYDPLTGKLLMVDSTNLSPVYGGMIFVDSSGVEHDILGNINNVPGDTSLFLNKEEEVDFHDTTCFIKSSLNYSINELRGVTGDVQLVLGVHSKDALTTKYLYLLIKYFIISRKFDLISRGFYLASYNGSDFNRDSQFAGDQVFTRFCTITGKVDDIWRSDQVVLIDNVEIDGTPVD